MNVAAFLSYIFLTTFTPGPNNLMSMSNAHRYGFKRALPFNFGVLVGFLLIMSGCALFSSFLYGLIPTLRPILLLLGAAYILWLAFCMIRPAPAADKSSQFTPNSFFAGVMLQFVNVKVILYGLTALSAFILPHYQSVPVLLFFVLLLSVTGFAGTCCWALFGAALDRFFTARRQQLNLFMALMLIFCAVSMVWELM